MPPRSAAAHPRSTRQLTLAVPRPTNRGTTAGAIPFYSGRPRPMGSEPTPSGGRMRWFITTLLAVPALGAPASGGGPGPRLLRVPAQYPTIQAAIDSARSGDTILVAPGRYFENLNYRDKALVLESRYALSRDPRDIARTIIDGSRPADPDTGSVVIITSKTDGQPVLQGFTITGGTGTVWFDARNHRAYREGGGVLCEFVSPRILDNLITGNEAVQPGHGSRSAGGGGIRWGNGIWIAGALTPRVPDVLAGNIIADNVARSGAGTIPAAALPDETGQAGAIFVYSGGVYRNAVVGAGNIIWGNRQAAGGAIAGDSTALRLSCSDVEGGWPGPGNLATDPEFGDTISYVPRSGPVAAVIHTCSAGGTAAGR